MGGGGGSISSDRRVRPSKGGREAGREAGVSGESQCQLIGATRPRSSKLESSCMGPGHGGVCVCEGGV